VIGTVANTAIAGLVAALDSLPDGDSATRAARVRTALLTTLADPAVLELYAERSASYLVWSREGGPAVHASVHRPGHVTAPHDHGPAWAVYGVVRGPASCTRWTRAADVAPGVADLGAPEYLELGAGEVSVVLPGQVHTVANRTGDWTWHLVVRARLLSEITRSVFDAETGAYRVVSPAGRGFA
jgi:predicted metal-dependent enzyme (double-stranded beta helix superfamily)